MGQAAIWKVGRGIVMLAANKLLERREAHCHVTKDCLATCISIGGECASAGT